MCVYRLQHRHRSSGQSVTSEQTTCVGKDAYLAVGTCLCSADECSQCTSWKTTTQPTATSPWFPGSAQVLWLPWTQGTLPEVVYVTPALCTACSSLHGPSCSLEAVCWRTNYKTTHSSEEMPGWFRGIEQRSPVVRNKPSLCSSHFVFSGWLVTATSLISNRKHALTPPHTHTQNGDSTLHMAALLWRSYINILIYSLRKGLLKFHHIPRTLPKPVGKIQAK